MLYVLFIYKLDFLNLAKATQLMWSSSLHVYVMRKLFGAQAASGFKPSAIIVMRPDTTHLLSEYRFVSDTDIT